MEKMTKPKLSIVIPARNEEVGLQKVLEDIKNLISDFDYEVIVVDDASLDQTPKIAELFDAKLIRHRHHSGYGAALKTGFQYAEGDYICFLDADYTYPVKAISMMMGELENYDMLIGIRDKKEMPFLRRIGNSIFSKMASFLADASIEDPASGLRIFKRDLIPIFEHLSDDLDFTPEMTVKCYKEGYRIKGIPISYRERIGKSKLGVISHGYQFFTSIIKMVAEYDPMRVFSPIGLMLISIGTISSFVLLFRRIVLGEISIQLTNGLILSTLFFLMGLQIFILGIMSTLIVSRKR